MLGVDPFGVVLGKGVGLISNLREIDYVYMVYRVYVKNCFFFNSRQPIPSTEESNSSDMRVTLIGWPFSVQPIAAQEREGEVAKYCKLLENNTIFNEHPVCLILY